MDQYSEQCACEPGPPEEESWWAFRAAFANTEQAEACAQQLADRLEHQREAGVVRRGPAAVLVELRERQRDTVETIVAAHGGRPRVGSEGWFRITPAPHQPGRLVLRENPSISAMGDSSSRHLGAASVGIRPPGFAQRIRRSNPYDAEQR